MSQIPDEFLRNYLDHRIPSIEKIERVRAAGITADDEWVETFAETLLDIRHAVRGGMREPKVNNWNADE
jgi:hypothetical protein